MTASEEALESLRSSGERIVNSLVTLGTRILTDPRVAKPLDCAQREMRQAKAVGQLTVLTANAKLKQTLQSPTPPDPAPAAAPPPVRDAPVAPTCIPEYENLSASQIVPLLRALDADERAEVLAYEEATRQRKTVIAAARKPLA